MMRTYARRRRTYRPVRKFVSKAVNRDDKQDRKITSIVRAMPHRLYQTEVTSVIGGAMVTNFNGISDLLGISNAAGYSALLTTLPSGINMQQRNNQVIQLTHLYGTVLVELPATSTFAVGGVSAYRLIILRAKSVHFNDAGAVVEPVLREALITATTTTASDLYCPLSAVQRQNQPKDRQYSIVYDHRFELSVPNYVSHRCYYSVRGSPNSRTTYLGTANNVGSTGQNHYFMYLFGISTQVAANIPVVTHNGSMIWYV